MALGFFAKKYTRGTTTLLSQVPDRDNASQCTWWHLRYRRTELPHGFQSQSAELEGYSMKLNSLLVLSHRLQLSAGRSKETVLLPGNCISRRCSWPKLKLRDTIGLRSPCPRAAGDSAGCDRQSATLQRFVSYHFHFSTSIWPNGIIRQYALFS